MKWKERQQRWRRSRKRRGSNGEEWEKWAKLMDGGYYIGGDNEREGQLNEGGDSNWVAKLKGYMELGLYYRGELGTS